MTLDSTELPAPPGDGQPDNPASNPPGGLASRDWKPPRWWTVPLPCLLTLPVAAWCVLIAALSNLCFDTCEPTQGLVTPVGVTEFFLGAATVVLLIVGLAVRTWRRTLRLALWITCGLACLGAGYLLTWASTHP
jgi:hypothetical protein